MRKITTDLLPVSGPTEHAIALANLKLHLKLGSSTSEDTLLLDDIDAACQFFEEQTGRVVAPATFDYTLDGVPSSRTIVLPVAPLLDVVSVSYVDETGATQTFDPANYTVEGIQSRGRGRVVLIAAGAWPTVPTETPSALTVRFVAGYANLAVSPLAMHVPALVAQAIRSLAAVFHKFRADTQEVRGNQLQTVPIGASAIIRAFRLPDQGDVWG